MAFFNKAEKGAVQRGIGAATTASAAEKGAVQNGAPLPALSVSISWDDLTLWVQGVKVSGA